MNLLKRAKVLLIGLAVAGIPLAMTASCDPVSRTLDVFRYDDDHDHGILDIFFDDDDYYHDEYYYDDCYYDDCYYEEIVIY